MIEIMDSSKTMQHKKHEGVAANICLKFLQFYFLMFQGWKTIQNANKIIMIKIFFFII